MWNFILIVSCLLLQTWAKDVDRLHSEGPPMNGISIKNESNQYLAISKNVTNQYSAISKNERNQYLAISKNETNQYTAVSKGSYSGKSMADAARMPGTNWCGKGWRADSFYKFGAYSGADRCCRQHDLGCHESIEPGQTKYGLTNVRFHAVMHCTCDERFRSCLRMAQTMSADIVGNLFFNVIKIPCFVFSRQKVCKNKTWWGKCLEKTKERVAMWRNSVSYKQT